jgi:hypothetical protein
VSRPAGRRRSSALALLLAVIVGIGIGAPAMAQDGATDAAYEVRLVSQSSYVTTGETFTMTLDIDGALPTDQIKVGIWGQARKPAERRQLRQAIEANDPNAADLNNLRTYSFTYGEVLDPSTGAATITIEPGPANDDPGAYPLTIGIHRGADRSPNLLTTTLIRLGAVDATGGPLDVALVLPVTAGLTHLADGTSSLPADDRARLEALGTSFTAGLGSLPLTVEPRPELLDTIAEGATAPDGAARARDNELLTLLRAVAQDRHLLSGSYVPIDEEAFRRRDLDLMVIDLHNAGDRAITDSGLGSPTNPPDHAIARTDRSDTADTLAMRRDLGAQFLVMPDDALEPLDEARFPATLLQSFFVEDSTGSPIRAVASDSYLADLAAQLDDDSREDDQPRLAQLFLADLIAGYRDDPATARGTVVVLPDDWDLTSTTVVNLLTEMSSLPELHLTDVESLASTITAAAPLGGGRTQSPSSDQLVRDLVPAPAADLGSYPTRAAQVDRELRGFESIAGAPGPLSADMERQRLVSADQQLDDDGHARYLAGIEARIRARLLAPDGGPGLVGPGTQRVTMTSRRATIPIQIDNRLGFAAAVRIELESEKLDFPTGWLRETTLAPGTNTIEVEVEAKTSGDSLLEVTVLPPDANSGLGTLATGSFTVRSTALSGVGLVISIVALGVLLVWWARHVRRTRRARRARADATATAAELGAESRDPDDSRDSDDSAPAPFDAATTLDTTDVESNDPTPTPTLTRTEI